MRTPISIGATLSEATSARAKGERAKGERTAAAALDERDFRTTCKNMLEREKRESTAASAVEIKAAQDVTRAELKRMQAGQQRQLQRCLGLKVGRFINPRHKAGDFTARNKTR